MDKEKKYNGIITNLVVNSNKLSKEQRIRTITISDLHSYTSNDNRATRLALAIKNEDPDIIFIAGDIFNGGKPWNGGEKLDKFKRFVYDISEVAPVCITWGNHDLRGLNPSNIDIRVDNLL